MPKILIVAATPFEIAALTKHFEITPAKQEGLFAGKNGISILLTGVGMVNTAYSVGREASPDFDHVINAGICGTFDPSLKIGDVVEVVSDTLAEMGAEDDGDFIKFSELNLGGSAIYYPRHNLHDKMLAELQKVKGITVNKVHGNSQSIKITQARYQPQTESMEGAAFFRACEHIKGSSLQIRAISNLVEKRDKSKWNMPLAIENLNRFLISFVENLIA